MTLDAAGDRAVAAAITWGSLHDAFVHEPLVAQAVEWWLRGHRSERSAQLILAAADAARTQVDRGMRPPFRTPTVSLGTGLPGVYTFDGVPLPIGLGALSAGLEEVGSPGSGKSTVLGHWLPAIAASGVCVVVVECAKREHRSVLPRCRVLGVECVVLRAEDLRLNPLDPQGLPLAGFTTALVDILAYVLDLRALGRVSTRQILEQEYARRDPLEPPTLEDLGAAWAGATERNALSRESARERFATLLMEVPEGVRRVRRGWWLDALCTPGRVVVLEVPGLSAAAQQWIALPLLYALQQRGLLRAGA